VLGAAGRGSVPSYPAPEAAVRALSRVVDYSAWLQRRPGEIAAFEDIDVRRAHRLVGSWLDAAGDTRDGFDLDFDQLAALLDIYGVTLWPRIEVSSLEEALAAGAKLGWDVVLKATAEHLRHRPDLGHVWRNIDTEAEMRDAWQTMQPLVASHGTAGFVVQKNAPGGVPVVVQGVEDPLFGPVVSFGVSGAATELLGDRAYRIPPMHALDAAEMVRDIKAAPLLFGYRGSDPVDTDSVERLLLQVAQLKNDLPQVRELDLSLVIVGLAGTTVLTASATVEPAVDARSDWYTRRMASEAGESFGG
jgi:acyl-CoA synthetase (NDP forming)